MRIENFFWRDMLVKSVEEYKWNKTTNLIFKMFHCELKTLNVWFLAENVCPYDRVIGSCCGSAIDHYYKLLEARNQIENNTSFSADLKLCIDICHKS